MHRALAVAAPRSFACLTLLVGLSLGTLPACDDAMVLPTPTESWEAAVSSSLRVVSWNLRHEGWSKETAYAADAQQIWGAFGSSALSPSGCDLVFLQEVMNDAAATSIATELTRISGVSWKAISTPLIGRTTYREKYAVLYRSDRVAIDSWWVVRDSLDLFEREPMVVEARDVRSGADYTFINWHAVFGTTTQRQAEVRQMAAVFSDVQAADPTDQDVILLGDHNLDATSAAWSNLTSLTPTVRWAVNDLTTLNASGGWASAYDHFWYQATYLTEYSSSGRDYVSNTATYVSTLSDHAPIWLRLYSTSDTD